MEALSITHWVIIVFVIVMMASPWFGVVRAVRNGAVLPAVISVLVPAYGLIYFFAARQPRN